EQCTQREKALRELQKRMADCTLRQAEDERARAAYLAAAKRSDTKRQEYEAKRRAFLDEQAGVLAQTLQAGQPCPVCGSADHPHPARLSAHAPSKEALEFLRQEAARLDQDAAQLSERAAESKAARERAEAELTDAAMETLGAREDLANRLLAETERSHAATQEAARGLAEAQQRAQRREKLEEGVPKAEAQLAAMAEQHGACERESAGRAAQAQAMEKQLAAMRQALPYADQAAAQRALDELTGREAALRARMEAAKAAYERSREEASQRRAQAQTLQAQLAQGSTDDSAALACERERLERSRAEARAVAQRLTERRNGNQQAAERIAAQARQLEETAEKARWMTTLSQTVNGTLTGKGKMTLETYVQTTYLDRVLARANTRLMRMSEGQYELKRRAFADTLRSQIGLELDVIDHYNGSERSVKSLSGGEQFKASLSLALGMSDEVQASAGGIRLDTLFVDEGFGTLDEESLGAAIDVLAGLSEGSRLVGVISHVQQLKERI
ncbi:MAG: SbcC/MukB-like Walker B domain-containing protein, partial [Eubacteriales bacterium]|nr:SbcC/MukB-like Walker B domain-containing protein [Eubacteriales bacterium]